MINVFLLVPALKPVSPVNAALALANSLSGNFKVSLVSYAPITVEQGEYANKIYGDTIELISLNSKGWLHYLKASMTLNNFIEQRNCEVVISFLFKCDFILSHLSSEVLKISSVRNMYQDEYRISYGLFIGGFFSFLHTKSLKKFNAVIAMSKDMKKFFLKEKISKSKVFLIPNFLDESRVKSLLKDRNSYVSLGHNSYKSIVSVSSLIKRKRIDLLIKYCIELYEEGFLFNLIIIGYGDQEESLKNMVNSHDFAKDYIYFTGYNPNPLPYLNKADLFVMTSESEGVSRSLMEALYLNKPCLISDIPGNRDFSRFSSGVFLFNDKKTFKDILKNILETTESSHLPIYNTEEYAVSAYADLIDKLYREHKCG